MILVLDASVALKWFFRSDVDEDHSGIALRILAGVDSRAIRLVQPPHFLAEMAAVLVRKHPAAAIENLRDLRLVAMDIADAPDLHEAAAEVAMRVEAHVFDALYHATALHHPGARLVTADRRYYQRAHYLGQISLLEGFELESAGD